MKRLFTSLKALAITLVLAVSAQPALADNPTLRNVTAPVALNIETLGQEVAYPTVLRDMGVQGLVLIKVRVDETGSITQAEVVSTPNPALAENCLRALPRLRFQPAVVDGTPTATWVTIPFRFQL